MLFLFGYAANMKNEEFLTNSMRHRANKYMTLKQESITFATFAFIIPLSKGKCNIIVHGTKRLLHCFALQPHFNEDTFESC